MSKPANPPLPVTLQVTRVTVLLMDYVTDTVTVYIAGAAPHFPAFPDVPTGLKTEVAHGTGIAWARATFGIEPEVVDARSKTK